LTPHPWLRGETQTLFSAPPSCSSQRFPPFLFFPQFLQHLKSVEVRVPFPFYSKRRFHSPPSFFARPPLILKQHSVSSFPFAKKALFPPFSLSLCFLGQTRFPYSPIAAKVLRISVVSFPSFPLVSSTVTICGCKEDIMASFFLLIGRRRFSHPSRSLRSPFPHDCSLFC